MNVHDSERIKGMLTGLGYGESDDPDGADVVVLNTCTVREKPDQKLFNQLDHVKGMKRRNPKTIVAVGGCLVEAQKQALFDQFPFVDVAFGPGHIDKLGAFLAALSGKGAGAGGVPTDNVGFFGVGDERVFAAELPQRRERSHQAWVQISMGCNSKCAYCIVPAVRGREKSRAAAEVITEIEMLAKDGVREITLLGQNVNSYGRDLPIETRVTFADLLRKVDAIDGVDRVRFTSPHPKDMREDVIAAMAECPSVCQQLHLPLQSGATTVLKRMRRTYSRERYLKLVDDIRTAMPNISLSTDIIVGFPGETDEEFEETVSMVREVEYDGAYTFIFSPRSGTEAAALEDLSHEVKQRRLERLIDVVRDIAAKRNERHVGLVQEVLVEGSSRTDEKRRRGRTEHNTIVNFIGTEEDAPTGSIVDVNILQASSETLRGELVVGSAR